MTNNKDSFADRIARLEGRETVAIRRSSNVDSQVVADFQQNKPGRRKRFLIKAVFVVLVCFFCFRVGAIFAGVDLTTRHAVLKQGGTSQKAAAALLGSLMIADGWLLPLLDVQEGKIEVASQDDESEVSEPSMVVHSVRTAVGTPSLKTLSALSQEDGHIVGEPIPVKQGLLSKVVDTLLVSPSMKPDLYFPVPSEGWFMITASDLSYQAEPYFAQKQSWTEAEQDNPKRRKWADLPLLKQLLTNKDNGITGAFKQDYAWYVHEETGDAIMLWIGFDHTAKAPTEESKDLAKKLLSKEAVTNSLANRKTVAFKVAEVGYMKKTLRDPLAIARLNFVQTRVQEYWSQLSTQVRTKTSRSVFAR